MLHRAAALLLAAVASCGPAIAQPAAFPQRPITIVAAFPPGGGADSVARLMSPKLSKLLGQAVVVDNKPGASGNIASEYVVHASPDGHTLLLNNNTLSINASLGFKQSFNVQRDLKPIAAVASTPIVIAVNSSLPVHNVAELVAYAKGLNGKANYSSCGNGTAQHFTGVRFTSATKVEMAHIPYRGCAPAIVDGLSGLVPVLFNTVPNLDAHVQAGKLRYIAVASTKRLPFRPDLPTIAETPGLNGFEAEVWFGLFAPASTPKEVAQRLERDVIAAMADKELQQGFADRLISTRVLNAEQFQKQIAADLVDWKRLADQFNVKVD